MSNHTYKFRFQNHRFELVGYDSSERHRGTGETTEYSINFSARKMTTFKMTIDDNNTETTSQENNTFKLDELKSIKSLKKPFKWEFNGIYL